MNEKELRDYLGKALQIMINLRAIHLFSAKEAVKIKISADKLIDELVGSGKIKFKIKGA